MTLSSQNRPSMLVFDHSTYAMMSQIIAYGPLILFAHEVIDYSLHQNNLLDWIPRMNLEYLRLKHADKRYFDNRIGEAINHSCTESYAVNSALKLGFDEILWLTLNPEEARERLIGYLGLILMHAEVPIDYAAFQMFSFACYVGRAAMKRHKNELVNEVVQALVHTCCAHFPYEKQYVEFSTTAESYNLQHRRLRL